MHTVRATARGYTMFRPERLNTCLSLPPTSALPEDAERAVTETNGKLWKRRALSVELANERKHFKLRSGACFASFIAIVPSRAF